MNFKKIALSGSLVIPAFGFTSQAYAATNINTCPQSGPFGHLCGLNIGTVIGTAITYVFVVAAILALAYLIWGGIKWIISGGDKNGVQAAKDTIIAALIGLVVIFLSYV